jgi:hypothetical protein
MADVPTTIVCVAEFHVVVETPIVALLPYIEVDSIQYALRDERSLSILITGLVTVPDESVSDADHDDVDTLNLLYSRWSDESV